MTNSKIKKVYLHIGLNKTATTSIQKALFLSKEVLLKEGYYYPVFTDSDNQYFNHNNVLLKYFKTGQANLVNSIIEENQFQGRIVDNKKLCKQSLIKQLQRFSDLRLIISAEGILTLNVIEIRNLKALLESLTDLEITVELIVFVRHPVYHAQSVLQQGVKMGFDRINRKSQMLILSSSIHFSATLDKFIQVFGKSAMRVYRFEDAILHPFGPAGMFLSIIGFPVEKMGLIKQVKSNESLSSEAVRILSMLNEKYPLFINGIRNTQRDQEYFNKIAKLPGQKFSFSPDDQKRIWMNSEEDRNWLIKNFNLPPFEFNSEHMSSYNNLWGIETLKQLEILVSDLPDEFKKIMAQVLESEMWRSDGSITEDSKKLMESQIRSICDSLPEVQNKKPMRRLALINPTNFESYFKAELSNPLICRVSDDIFILQPVNIPFVLNIPKVMKSYESKTFVVINFHSSKSSTITLEYQTQTNFDFETSFPIKKIINEGMNNIEFIIPDFDFNGKTRLIFHDSEVVFKIQEIEIKTDSLSYENLLKENERIKKQIESIEKAKAKFDLQVKSGFSNLLIKVRNLLNTIKSRLF